MKKCNVIVSAREPRRKIGKAYGSIAGIHPFRGREAVPFESTLERDFVVQLEGDPSVLGVTSQPMTIDYRGSDGAIRSYTPDFLVTYRGWPRPYRPPALVEVKPAEKLRRHLTEWRTKFRAAIRYSKSQGFVFHLMHEAKIRDQRWQNSMFLQRYRKMGFDAAESNRIIGHLHSMGTATFDHLLARNFFGEHLRAVGISHLWHLVATGRITCDLDQPLSPLTELWVPEDEI